jgi:hypothetical protein
MAVAERPCIHRFRAAIAVIAAAILAGTGDAGGETGADPARRFELRIENGRLVGTLKVIRVRRNDRVEIVWSADRRTVVHLHGYDIETAIDAGAPKTVSFRARATGRFPIERHGKGRHHSVLIYLEVHPR